MQKTADHVHVGPFHPLRQPLEKMSVFRDNSGHSHFLLFAVICILLPRLQKWTLPSHSLRSLLGAETQGPSPFPFSNLKRKKQRRATAVFIAMLKTFVALLAKQYCIHRKKLLRTEYPEPTAGFIFS